MSKENVVLLIICGLIASGIGVLVSVQMSPKTALQKWATNLASGAPAAITEEKAPEPVKPAPPKARKAAVVLKAELEPVFEQAIEPKVEKAAAPPTPQPELTDIPAGMPRNALLERYPVPALQTSTLRDGNLMELLVYQKKGAPLATYAQLENGAVTKVYAGIPARRLP